MKLTPEIVSRYLIKAFGHRSDLLVEAGMIETWDDLMAVANKEPVIVCHPRPNEIIPLETYGLDKVDPVRLVVDHVIF